jgi:hypothetical protein
MHAPMSEEISNGAQCEARVSTGGARESVGSWSNSHCFIPLKQNVCRRSVAYDTNSGSSSPFVSVTCQRPRPALRSAASLEIDASRAGYLPGCGVNVINVIVIIVITVTIITYC